jgi:D-sedoheptulose 7-phosphate isomerase
MLARAADAMGRAAALEAPVLAVVDRLESCLRADGRLWFCGNGGSMAEAMHLATELSVRLRSAVARPSWPAMALGADASALSAAGNDFGFEHAFARPLSGLGRRGDVLLALTTSGRSANVLRALETARGMGIGTVGLLGGDGGPAAALCDHALVVTLAETARIQEAHLALGHAILELLEDRMLRAA